MTIPIDRLRRRAKVLRQAFAAGDPGARRRVAAILPGHETMYGGDLMGTVIHGAEFCPSRARRDHLACARLILDTGATVKRSDIDGCGVVDMAEMLQACAEAHPDRVIAGA